MLFGMLFGIGGMLFGMLFGIVLLDGHGIKSGNSKVRTVNQVSHRCALASS